MDAGVAGAVLQRLSARQEPKGCVAHQSSISNYQLEVQTIQAIVGDNGNDWLAERDGAFDDERAFKRRRIS